MRLLPPAGRIERGSIHWKGRNLLGFGWDLIFAHKIEEILRAVAQHGVEALASLAMSGDHRGRIMAGQRRNDLAVIAPGGTPARFGGFQDGDADPALAQMDRGRQAGEAGTDHHDVALDCTVERSEHGTGLSRRGPERGRPGDGREGGHSAAPFG